MTTLPVESLGFGPVGLGRVSWRGTVRGDAPDDYGVLLRLDPLNLGQRRDQRLRLPLIDQLVDLLFS
jgi:hypothetical protein